MKAQRVYNIIGVFSLLTVLGAVTCFIAGIYVAVLGGGGACLGLLGTGLLLFLISMVLQALSDIGIRLILVEEAQHEIMAALAQTKEEDSGACGP